jgi:septal ring factor EnvC (AmiA/AmiB activator)
MSQQHILNYDSQDYDLNSLFMFSFDQLKFLITSLAKNQKHAIQRINDIEDKITVREKKIDELEKQLKKQENFMATKFKNITSIAVNNAANKGEFESKSSMSEIPSNVNSTNNFNNYNAEVYIK